MTSAFFVHVPPRQLSSISLICQLFQPLILMVISCPTPPTLDSPEMAL